MPSTALLTADDLDEIGCSLSRLDRPLEVVAELVEAVEQGRVADQSDTGYALLLAAEITERTGDLSAAATLAARAAEQKRLLGASDGYARAYHAQLLLQLGRQDEGMAEFSTLRPLLCRDPDAVHYLSEALETAGHPEIAEQWLTAALLTAVQDRDDVPPERSTQVASMVSDLVQVRHRVRRDLGLLPDDHDHLAARLMDRAFGALVDNGLPDEQTILLFWPQPEFERLLLRWPVLAEHYGQNWAEYRARCSGPWRWNRSPALPCWRCSPVVSMSWPATPSATAATRPITTSIRTTRGIWPTGTTRSPGHRAPTRTAGAAHP